MLKTSFSPQVKNQAFSVLLLTKKDHVLEVIYLFATLRSVEYLHG